LLKSVLPNYKNINDANIELDDLIENKFSVIYNDEYLPKFKHSENIYEVVEELVNFQIDVFKQKNKFTIIQDH
jgi:hypothetical protein